MKKDLVRMLVTVLVASATSFSMAAEPRQCPDGAVIYDPEAGISEPVVVTKVIPAYPDTARKERVTGVVVLDTVIDREGTVWETQAVQDPDERLTRAAAEAVLQWTFEPATDADGTAITVCYLVTVRFKLH